MPKSSLLDQMLSNALQVGINQFPEKDSDYVWLSNYFPQMQFSILIYSPEEIYGYVRTPFNLFKNDTTGILDFLPVKVTRVLKQGYGEVYEFKLPNTQEEINLADLSFRVECCIISLQTLAEKESEFDKEGDLGSFKTSYERLLKSALLRYASFTERKSLEKLYTQ